MTHLCDAKTAKITADKAREHQDIDLITRYKEQIHSAIMAGKYDVVIDLNLFHYDLNKKEFIKLLSDAGYVVAQTSITYTVRVSWAQGGGK